LYNNQMILDAKTKKSLLGLGRSTGFVINQSRVETDLGKCAYIWDGATSNKYHRGCGMGAPADCDNEHSAFHNICPSTGKLCTAEDGEVKNNLCEPYGGTHPIPANEVGEPQCAFPGPAMSYVGQTDFKPSESHLRDMAKARLKYNEGSDDKGPHIEKWNEIVVDETLMLPDIWQDPALIIPAFIYTKSGLPLSKQMAKQMRDEFCKHNKVSPIPLVEVDDTVFRPDGPFTLPSDDSSAAPVTPTQPTPAPTPAQQGGDSDSEKPSVDWQPEAAPTGAVEMVPATWTRSWKVWARSEPMTQAEAVEYLNKLYTGWDENDDSTPLGVTISMAAQVDTFYGNIFCSTHENPKGDTKCWNGGADCRLSASLYNNKMILDAKTGKSLLGLGRSTGFVIDQTRVETDFGKCAFLWDGATNNKYNRGCGDGAPTNDCDNTASAFHNICPSTKKVCTSADDEVKRGLCKPYGGLFNIPEIEVGRPACAFPGPALNYFGQKDFTPGQSALRDMAKSRVQYSNGTDDKGPNVEKWNEIVVDEKLMLPEIWEDPAKIIPAFIYTKSGLPLSYTNAEKMRDEFCAENHVNPIPLVEVDDTEYRAEGPFTLPSVEQSFVEVTSSHQVRATREKRHRSRYSRMNKRLN